MNFEMFVLKTKRLYFFTCFEKPTLATKSNFEIEGYNMNNTREFANCYGTF